MPEAVRACLKCNVARNHVQSSTHSFKSTSAAVISILWSLQLERDPVNFTILYLTYFRGLYPRMDMCAVSDPQAKAGSTESIRPLRPPAIQ